MSNQRHELLFDIFRQAVELSDDARRAYLDEHCLDELRPQVEELLKRDASGEPSDPITTRALASVSRPSFLRTTPPTRPPSNRSRTTWVL